MLIINQLFFDYLYHFEKMEVENYERENERNNEEDDERENERDDGMNDTESINGSDDRMENNNEEDDEEEDEDESDDDVENIFDRIKRIELIEKIGSNIDPVKFLNYIVSGFVMNEPIDIQLSLLISAKDNKKEELLEDIKVCKRRRFE